jgi:hypothetical protein
MTTKSDPRCLLHFVEVAQGLRVCGDGVYENWGAAEEQEHGNRREDAEHWEGNRGKQA